MNSIKKVAILLLFSCIATFASGNEYDLRLAYGRSDAKNFGDIIMGTTAPSPYKTHVINISSGYKLVNNFYNFPLDIYIEAGLSKFLENDYNKDIYENTICLKGYYKFNFLHNQVRFGAAEGASYTYGTLQVEKQDAKVNHGHVSHYLNYIELSLDFDAGRLIHYKPFFHTYLGVYLKHRSGIFGLINNVKHGGSNFICYYVQKVF